jgi:glycosyltransferase involved in cell wall biosynthesis
MKVLHLLGAREDTGGILAVIRSLDEAGGARCRNAAWVNEHFEQRRRPELDLRMAPYAMDESSSHLRLLAAAARSWPSLRRLLRKETFDIVHGHSRGAFPLMLALAACGWTRLIYTNHTYAKRTAMYRVAAKCRRVRWVFLTPNMARHYGLRPALGRVESISACVADGYFNVPLRPHRRRLTRWVGVGNLVRWKRWDLAAEALRRLSGPGVSDITLTVFGPTPDDSDAKRYEAELRVLACAPELAGRFALAGPTHRIGEELAGADGLLLPSTNEPCSVALMEALASGKPAVVSATGGNVDIIENGRTGVLFKDGDPDDLARVLRDAAGGGFAPAAPEAVRESVRSRSAAAVFTKYLALYRELRATAAPG